MSRYADILQNLCEEVAKFPTKENLSALDVIVTKIPATTLGVLQSYILYPLHLHLLNKDLQSDTKIQLIKCIASVLKQTQVKTLPDFFRLHSVVFNQIYSLDDGGLNNSSEELKLEVVICGTILFKKCTIKVLEEIYEQKNAPPLSQGVFLAIQIAQLEKFAQLRLAALKYLLTAAQSNNNISYELKRKVGDVFMVFLPGTLGPLTEIINHDDKQQSKITCSAIQCWGKILTLVMEDTEMNKTKSDKEILLSWTKIRPKTQELNEINPEQMKEVLNSRKRTTQWIEAAAFYLKNLIKKVTNCRNYSHINIKLELVTMSELVLNNCVRNLKNSVIAFLELLISLSEDEDENVAKKSRGILFSFSKKYQSSNESMFMLLEENFCNLISSLPRVVTTGDDNTQTHILNLTIGYLRILGLSGRLKHLLSSVTLLNRFVTCLIHVCCLETSNTKILVDYSTADSEDYYTINSKPWIQLKHYRDQSTCKKLGTICHVLCVHCDVEVITDCLIDRYNTDKQNGKEIIYIMNEMMTDEPDVCDVLLKCLLNFYTDSENWYLQVETNEELDVALKDARDNVVKVCLILDGIGKLAKLTKKNYERYLLNTLYFVLEKCGSKNHLLSHAATTAAREMSVVAGLDGDISKLIANNIDYLTYHVTVKLRRWKDNESVFDVVTVVMKYSKTSAGADLQEIINQVILRCTENMRVKNAVLCLRVFRSFVFYVARCKKSEPALETNKELNERYDPVSQLKQYIKSVEIANSFNKDCEDFTNEDLETPVDEDNSELLETPVNEDKTKLPTEIVLTISVLKQCLNHLSSKDNARKLIVLETLNQGVEIIQCYENELLPIVHQIWSPLVHRFDENVEPLIMNKSFVLLCTLANKAKDFIRSRTLKEVLPSINKFLVKNFDKSKKKDSGSGYYFTQLYKLQREILSRLGQLTVDLNLFEKQTDCVVDAIIPYLSSLQPRELQENAKRSLTILLQHDPYLIWLKLQQVQDNVKYKTNCTVLMSRLLDKNS